MAIEPRYPQLPREALELWLALPMTRAYLQCLDWRRLDTRDALGEGKPIDSTNADLTHAVVHSELGKQQAYADALNPAHLLSHYEMIEIKRADDEPGGEKGSE